MVSAVDTQSLDLVRELLATVTFVVVSALLTQAFAWLSSRRQDEQWRGGVERLEKVVQDAVDEVEQTYVKPAKLSEGGPMPADRQQEALRQAQTIAVQSLGQAGAKAVASRLGLNSNDLERRIKSMIEATLARKQR